jgi:hypothetical protein
MKSHFRRSLAVALLTWTTGVSAQTIDCSTPTGALALMMAGSIDPSTAQCGSLFSGFLSCAAQSRLFLIDQGSPNFACAQHVRMHLFFAASADALFGLPLLSTQPNWVPPANVGESSPNISFIRTTGSNNIYRTGASFPRGHRAIADMVFYRWGKEIVVTNGINPWVFSEILSFAVPTSPLPPAPPKFCEPRGGPNCP